MAAATPTPINRASDMPESTPLTERTPEQVADLLRRPFHPSVLKQKPVDGGMVSYVDIGNVIERLNKAAPVWHWKVTGIEIHTMPIKRKGQHVPTQVIHVTGELTIPGLGSRQGIGTEPCERSEDAGKIAESDAIKRAATMFGVPCGR